MPGEQQPPANEDLECNEEFNDAWLERVERVEPDADPDPDTWWSTFTDLYLQRTLRLWPSDE